MPEVKTREAIIAECAGAVASCFNYYSDVPLHAREVKRVRQALERLLPLEVSTTGYDAQAAAYEAEHAEELAEKAAVHGIVLED